MVKKFYWSQSNDNLGLLHISQASKTGASSLDFSMTSQGHAFLEVALHKAPAVRPFTTHHENNPR